MNRETLALRAQVRSLKHMKRILNSPIYAWRVIHGFTQAQAGAVLGYKARSNLSRWETGKIAPRRESWITLRRTCR